MKIDKDKVAKTKNKQLVDISVGQKRRISDMYGAFGHFETSIVLTQKDIILDLDGDAPSEEQIEEHVNFGANIMGKILKKFINKECEEQKKPPYFTAESLDRQSPSTISENIQIKCPKIVNIPDDEEEESDELEVEETEEVEVEDDDEEAEAEDVEPETEDEEVEVKADKKKQALCDRLTLKDSDGSEDSVQTEEPPSPLEEPKTKKSQAKKSSSKTKKSSKKKSKTKKKPTKKDDKKDDDDGKMDAFDLII